ncbi:MAG: hypothetical protein JWP63_1255 [Candidatus Solibacter sp.]|nr:hypothetical protein [Candidatus Solibacter sp.]
MPQPSNQNWKPPDRLGYSSLRPVSLTKSGIFMMVLTGILVVGGFAAGIFLARAARLEAQRQRLLDQQGITTEATVTRVWRTSDKSNQPRVAYRYQFEGSIYTGSVNAPRDLWRGLKVGSRLIVRFVPSQPSISHPVDWQRRDTPVWLPYLVAAMLAGIGVIPVWRLAFEMRLLAEGRPAAGRVTAIRNAKGPVVHYEFELPNGTKLKGRARVSKAPPPGETVCILYDPERPKRNALYPMSLVKLDS